MSDNLTLYFFLMYDVSRMQFSGGLFGLLRCLIGHLREEDGVKPD